MTEPDPVDDVILNVLPRYAEASAAPQAYDADIDRIRRAFRTDSSAQRDKLVSSLRESFFVAAIDAETRQSQLAKPTQVYIATERLSKLFEDIPGVSLVDDRYDYLRGEEMRELLEASGATRYLAPVLAPNRLTESERAALRKQGGCENWSSEKQIEDYTLRGLDELLRRLPKMPREQATERARLLWEGLGELLERRRQAVFTATYRWVYYQERSTTTDADFIRTLNMKAWIPTPSGKLAPPSEVDFQELGWRANPVLESKIRFKPPLVELLAREAGIDPAILSLLKQMGLTDLASLQERLQLTDTETDDLQGDESDEVEETDTEESPSSANLEDDGDEEENDGEAEGFDEGDGDDRDADEGGKPLDDDQAAPSNHNGGGLRHHDQASRTGENRSKAGGADDGSKRTASRGNTKGSRARHSSPIGRRFISYVAAEPHNELTDPDGLTSDERNALEEKAILLILEKEPALERTPPGNKGFDLVEKDAAGEPERWIEVKAMAATLENRPVGMSAAQFEFARKASEQFWLYVVETAGDREKARIVKIQNPARRAGYFTYDFGWLAAAETEVFDEPA